MKRKAVSTILLVVVVLYFFVVENGGRLNFFHWGFNCKRSLDRARNGRAYDKGELRSARGISRNGLPAHERRCWQTM